MVAVVSSCFSSAAYILLLYDGSAICWTACTQCCYCLL